ncbi:MAG: HAD-IC family P-type ATPase, partial [Deltaproteobacteria bacterium]|nr:HAD-IC family P-type ATPase [Deltaproteobacteria bacterium]
MSAYNISSPHNELADAVVKALGSSAEGLDRLEVEERVKRFGPNVLPSAKPPGALRIFFHQFTSPLIYILLAAAAVSLLIREWSDAVFISGVLLLNAVIGTIQEYSAQRAAASLKQLVRTSARVVRGGDTYEISARELVPGDIVVLESGDKVPADMRLLTTLDLEVDESLLTGESEGVHKDAEKIIAADSGLSGRLNMVFAGTLVNRGRGRGVVVATALSTELGRIAEAVLGKRTARPPLLIRMDRFVKRVAVLISGVAVLLAVVALTRGMALNEVFLLGVALAVSAIPEGLPVALTIALAIGMQRMARRNVIVRRLVAVEALGSCTFIATDKTGTLTENQLTVRRIVLPFAEPWEVTGESMQPQGEIVTRAGILTAGENKQLQRFCRAAVLANEGFLAHRDHGWTCHGDAVDVALLVMAHKVGVVQAATAGSFPETASIPFESQRMFSASLSTVDGVRYAFVK